MITTKNLHILSIKDVNNLYVQAMLQNVPVNNLSGLKILLNLMKFSEKNRMKKVMKDIFWKKNYMNFIIIYHFYQKE